MHNDTIAAVATPPGVGGIAVIRLSGPDALTVALGILSVHTLQPRHATYCSIADIDDGIATYFTAPHSFTGEETVELACHGSLYLQQAILEYLSTRPSQEDVSRIVTNSVAFRELRKATEQGHDPKDLYVPGTAYKIAEPGYTVY